MAGGIEAKQDTAADVFINAAGETPDALCLQSPEPIAERRFVWKLDLIVLPLLAIIYFTNSLDRANLGNAKTDGFEADIGLTGI